MAKTPHILWGQTSEYIYLSINININNIDINKIQYQFKDGLFYFEYDEYLLNIQLFDKIHIRNFNIFKNIIKFKLAKINKNDWDYLLNEKSIFDKNWLSYDWDYYNDSDDNNENIPTVSSIPINFDNDKNNENNNNNLNVKFDQIPIK
jgi:hypothetical protein